MIKKLYLLAVCLWPVILMAQGGAFTISANVKGLKNGSKVYLLYSAGDQSKTDSATVQAGKFAFRGKVNEPYFASMYLHKNPQVNKPAQGEVLDMFRLIIEPGATILSAPDSLKHIIISGSKINNEYKQLKALRKPIDDKEALLDSEYDALSAEQKKDKQIFAGIVSKEDQLTKERGIFNIDFARKHPNSYLSVVALYDYSTAAPGLAASGMQAYKLLNPKLKATDVGKKLTTLFSAPGKTKIGNLAMDFTQTDPAGKAVKLSDFKGKYVLIDFWASWCGPCRAANPGLVATYNQYKEKGFTILGVSLDNPGKKDSWLKAIEKDKLTWTQVSDLKGWSNTAAENYGVRSIPANFLIDPAGKIIAKDLKDEALSGKLAELLGAASK